MTVRRPAVATLFAAIALLALLTAAPVHAQPRPLGPPSGTDLEGTDTQPSEKSEKEVDAPPPPSPSAGSNAPKLPSGAPDDAKRAGTKGNYVGAKAGALGHGGNLSDLEIPLDIPLTDIPNYRAAMRDIVQDLSRYARSRDPKFVVVARPGFDLVSWSQREFDLAELQRDPNKIVPIEMIRQVGMPMSRYVQAIDGFVLDGHFCSPLRVPHADLAAARSEGLKALAVDICASNEAVITAQQEATHEGIITFATTDKMLGTVPKRRPIPENPGNVEALGQAKNMLMLLSAKSFGSRDEWFTAMQANNYDMLVIDAFDRKDQPLTKAEVHQLKFKEVGARRLVLARLDVGFADDTKYYWQRDWEIGKPSWIVGANPDVPSQYATEFWNPAWKAIVGKYLAGIMDLGFDGVMLDGVEIYRRWEAKTPIEAKR